MNSTLALSGPQQYIESLPSILGFTPLDSIVLTWLKDGKVVVSQRVDMEPALKGDGWRQVFEPIRRQDVNEVIIVFWGGVATQDAADIFIAHAQAETTVRDALWVADDRWGSMLCDDEACCPAEGKPFHRVDDVTRASIEAEWGFPEPAKIKGMRKAIDGAFAADREGERDSWIDTIVSLWTDGVPFPVEAAYALADIRVRDSVMWLAIDAFGTDPDLWRMAYSVARGVAEQTPRKHAAPIATLAAIFAWQAGDGARALIANGYAIECDPDYSLARLIEVSLGAGLPPAAWQEGMSGLSYDDCRYGSGS